MMFIEKVLIGSLLIVVSLDSYEFSDSSLVALVQVFRHGERTPLAFYTNDPYSNLSQYWNDVELGSLTNEGKRQHLSLGQLTKTRYADFLPTKYKKNAVYAQTTDREITHMSAQCNLYGLFPAIQNQKWSEETNWQPIPVHQADPNVLYSEPNQCKNYVPLVEEVWNTDAYRAIEEKYKDTFMYLSTHTGDNITNGLDAFTVFECLDIEYGTGLQLPEWANKVYPEPLTTLAGLGYKSFTETTKLKQLAAGRFLNEVVTYFSEMASSSTSSQKYRLYSGHVNNIASVLNIFGVFDPADPPAFASSIWMELRKAENKYTVNVYSKNKDKLQQIAVNGCDLDCPLDDFKEKLQEYLLDVDGWNKICQ